MVEPFSKSCLWRTDDIIVGTSSTRVEVIDCFIDLGQSQTQKKTVKVEKTTNFLNLFSARMANSHNLPPKFFIKGDVIPSDNHIFICYQNFENTLMSYLSKQPEDYEIRQIIKDLFESLHYLHRRNISHGHIHHLNMFVLEGRGYLGGGTGQRVEDESINEWNLKIKEIDDFKHDILCFASNVRECFAVNNRDIGTELYCFVEFIQKEKTLECSLHPFLLSPGLKKQYYLDVIKLLDSLRERHSQFHDMAAYQRILNKFASVMSNYRNLTSKIWQNNARAKGGIYASALNRRSYDLADIESFVKFARNCWCHAEIDPGKSVGAHDEEVDSILQELWPECLIIVHYSFYYLKGKYGLV